MALVYSYIRFSTKKQMKGSSLDRQRDGEKWIARNGHTAASLQIRDLGVSAFRGKHRHKGALSKFLELARAGQIPTGSILLVEHLDRLTREGVDEAHDLFREILRAGIKIAVLMPTEIVFEKSDLNDFMKLMIVLMGFYQNHEQSKTKSDRLRKAWKRKRESARATGAKFNKRRPCWLDWKGGHFVPNRLADAVKFIFERTADGIGQRQMLADLHDRFDPPGDRWNSSFVQKVLADRAVLGELQPKGVDEQGERQAIGDPIPGYYPAIIDESVWHRAQASKRAKVKQKGPNGSFVNLFTGLVKNVVDGNVMHIQTTRSGGTEPQRRLVSYGHLCKQKGSDPVTVHYGEFERAVLTYLTEVNAADVAKKGEGNLLRERQQELAGVQARLGELTQLLADPMGGKLASVIQAVAKLETRAKELSEEVERLQQQVHSARPIAATKDLIAMLDTAEGDERHELRMRLRMHVAELVETILVKPEKHRKHVFFIAQIQFKSGLMKQVYKGPGGNLGGWKGQTDEQDFAIDLRDKKALRERFFSIEEPEPEPIPDELPNKLADSAAVYLRAIRHTMVPDSFRMIPSKVRKFCDAVGPARSVASLDRLAWTKWTRWIREQVATGVLKHTTARLTYQRSREFVYWLIERGAVESWAGLDTSGEKVLA